jgi:hypothetical protein
MWAPSRSSHGTHVLLQQQQQQQLPRHLTGPKQQATFLLNLQSRNKPLTRVKTLQQQMTAPRQMQPVQLTKPNSSGSGLSSSDTHQTRTPQQVLLFRA